MQTIDKQRNNYKYFQTVLPELLADPQKAEKYAVIHEESIRGLYDTFASAYRAACTLFIKDFIIQQIVDDKKIVNFLSPAVAL